MTDDVVARLILRAQKNTATAIPAEIVADKPEFIPNTGASGGLIIEAEFVDEEVAARIIGFAVGTLQQWRVKGTGPPYYKKTNGNKQGPVRYKVSELREWMHTWRRSHTSEP
jgi:hypothetical protein